MASFIASFGFASSAAEAWRRFCLCSPDTKHCAGHITITLIFNQTTDLIFKALLLDIIICIWMWEVGRYMHMNAGLPKTRAAGSRAGVHR